MVQSLLVKFEKDSFITIKNFGKPLLGFGAESMLRLQIDMSIIFQ